MGNNCCADQPAQYQYSKDQVTRYTQKLSPEDVSKNVLNSHYKPSSKNIRTDSYVEKTKNKLLKFEYKDHQPVKSGTYDSQPHALNKGNLIYVGEWLQGIPQGKG